MGRAGEGLHQVGEAATGEEHHLDVALLVDALGAFARVDPERDHLVFGHARSGAALADVRVSLEDGDDLLDKGLDLEVARERVLGRDGQELGEVLQRDKLGACVRVVRLERGEEALEPRAHAAHHAVQAPERGRRAPAAGTAERERRSSVRGRVERRAVRERRAGERRAVGVVRLRRVDQVRLAAGGAVPVVAERAVVVQRVVLVLLVVVRAVVVLVRLVVFVIVVISRVVLVVARAIVDIERHFRRVILLHLVRLDSRSRGLAFCGASRGHLDVDVLLLLAAGVHAVVLARVGLDLGGPTRATALARHALLGRGLRRGGHGKRGARAEWVRGLGCGGGRELAALGRRDGRGWARFG